MTSQHVSRYFEGNKAPAAGNPTRLLPVTLQPSQFRLRFTERPYLRQLRCAKVTAAASARPLEATTLT